MVKQKKRVIKDALGEQSVLEKGYFSPKSTPLTWTQYLLRTYVISR